jgi:hypothetical protein
VTAPTRPYTPNEHRNGRCVLHVKRACNGCGELIGDVTDQEIEAAIDGLPLTDVRHECPWCATKTALAEVLAEQSEFDADLAYLRSYSAALLKHALPLLPEPAADSVHEQLIKETPFAVFCDLANIMSPQGRLGLIWSVP